ncbi:MarR family transcriptional regulator [Kutzneria sp. NPDC051319]|uniref:MarR family transcriptional regulator n=1 Tax=Kutzneria sp. NPDC051319 TaxID=3155047 RepID=UPI00342B51C2
MSNTNRTDTARATDTTGAPDRALRSVPGQTTTHSQRTDAEDKLWAALHAMPNSTTTDLAAVAVIGKSTAGKILARWAGEGSVTRTPGIAVGGRRAADIWMIAETDTETVTGPDAAINGTGTETDGAPADEPTVQNTAPADTALSDAAPDEPITAPADPDPADIADATPVEDNLSAPVDAAPAGVAEETTQDTTPADAEPEKSDPADPAPGHIEETEPGDSATATDATAVASDGGKDGTSERLAPGALRGMVEDWLRDHPSEQVSPTAIAKALGGKSSGAVSNALDKLVADGVAVKTQDKPRRFGLAPAQQEAAAPPAH